MQVGLGNVGAGVGFVGVLICFRHVGNNVGVVVE